MNPSAPNRAIPHPHHTFQQTRYKTTHYLYLQLTVIRIHPHTTYKKATNLNSQSVYQNLPADLSKVVAACGYLDEKVRREIVEIIDQRG